MQALSDGASVVGTCGTQTRRFNSATDINRQAIEHLTDELLGTRMIQRIV
jgi:hypothetical protein